MLDSELDKAVISLAPIGDGRWRASVRFSSGFSGFQGHFPGSPVLPGVMHLELARHLAERVNGKPHRIRQVIAAKFTRRVVPGETLEVALSLASFNGELRAEVETTAEGEPAARFSLSLVTI